MSECPLPGCDRTIPCRPPAPTCPHTFDDDGMARILHGLPLGVCRRLGHDASDDEAIAMLTRGSGMATRRARDAESHL